MSRKTCVAALQTKVLKSVVLFWEKFERTEEVRDFILNLDIDLIGLFVIYCDIITSVILLDRCFM